MSAIEAGVPAGITIDQLKLDVESLIANNAINIPQLVNWCSQIEKVTTELNELYRLVEEYMPHKTNGSCFGLDVVEENNLLSMMFNIQHSQTQFDGEIQKIKNRVMKITAGKEQLGLLG